jgi:hypothetical protein
MSKKDRPVHTSSHHDLVFIFALVLLLAAAGIAVWLNLATIGQMVVAVLAEAVRGIFFGLLRAGGPDEYDDGPDTAS